MTSMCCSFLETFRAQPIANIYKCVYEIPYDAIYTTSVLELQNYTYTYEDTRGLHNWKLILINTYFVSFLTFCRNLRLGGFDLCLIH